VNKSWGNFHFKVNHSFKVCQS